MLANEGGTAEVRFRPDLDESVFYLSENQMFFDRQSTPAGNPGFRSEWLGEQIRSTLRGNEVPMRISTKLVEMCGLVVHGVLPC